MTQHIDIESALTGSFKLVNKLNKQIDPSCLIPVRKYVSSSTGMKLYVCDIDGPVVEGYFSLATEAIDDDGLPHTLEHMIFLGSEDYPYAGVLDILANKVFAAGTNAWTDIDNTTYTISTIEQNGFLQLLPIYLDHILFPLLKESGFITEVYHVNGDGEDGGVVYSEMQSAENEDETIVERAMNRTIYPNEDCGYRYETGGMLKNLRTSTSHKKVVDYHRKMYKPENLAIVVAGQINTLDLIKVLEEFEKKILVKNPDTWKLNEKPFTRPIDPLTENIEQTVYFPSDKEENSNGIVAIGWRGPHISNLKELLALDLLFSYLAESSISPIHEHFIDKKSYCNKISYQVQEYKETYVAINFTNTQLEHLDSIKSELFEILNDLVNKKIDMNMNRMMSILKMKINELIDKFEDSPHDTVSKICIGDFLYGNSEDNFEFKSRFAQINLFESLKSETGADFWLNLIEKYFLKAFSVTIIAKPCEKLMKSIGEEDKQRVEERKRNLGKKGLKDLKTAVENAIDENDDFEIPDEIYQRIKVPQLDNVQLKNLKQFFSYETITESFEPINNGFKNFDTLKHLQLQVDHLDGTNFAYVFLMIDTSSLDKEQRSYLQLFINLLFESPINDKKSVNLTRKEAVFEIANELLEFEASIGINGSEFEPGIYPQYLSVFTKAPVNDYALAIKWLKLVVFHSVFDKEQIQITVSNLLKEIKKRKHQPHDVLLTLAKDLNYDQNCNLCLNAFLHQESLLKEINDNIAIDLYVLTLIEKLEKLRDCLLRDKQLRFYLCADLNQLFRLNSDLDKIWLDMFPSDGSTFVSNKPFEVFETWQMKKNHSRISSNSSVSEQIGKLNIWSQAPKKDYIISLGSTESSFVRLTSTIDINSYKHENYAALLVLIEYFTQTEGPLWESVRGPGFAYHQGLSLNPETAQLDLFLDECSHLVKAYEATRAIFMEHISNKNAFNNQSLETAKNSLIFLLIDDLKSVSNYSAYSMCTLFKGVHLNGIYDLIKKIEKVELKDFKRLLKSYIMPLFDDEHSNCIIVCHPAKTESITDEFSKMFDRKLNLIGKVDECFCATGK